jgi:uncharacterized protein YlxW (UPF0749 family)
MADKKKDKKGNAKEKSITDILSESRNVLYGENVELTSVLTNVLLLLGRMDTRLFGIEHNTSVNTTTLSQMNDKLTSLNARVITAETEIVGVNNRVAELETSSQGTSNLFDEVNEVNSTPERESNQVNHGRHTNCILNDINSKHCDCVNQGVINLLSLNVCGLIRRSQYPDVIELINKYEILCFVETKTDDADKINIPGFDVIMTN